MREYHGHACECETYFNYIIMNIVKMDTIDKEVVAPRGDLSHIPIFLLGLVGIALSKTLCRMQK